MKRKITLLAIILGVAALHTVDTNSANARPAKFTVQCQITTKVSLEK